MRRQGPFDSWTARDRGRLAAGLALALGLALVLFSITLAHARPPLRLVISPKVSVHANTVLVKDIAKPYGEYSRSLWNEVANIEILPAPERGGRPLTLNKARIKGVFLKYLGEIAHSCSYPGQLTVYRGGDVLTEADVERRIVEFLTPRVKAQGWNVEYKEFQVPEAVYLEPDFGELEIELAGRLKPGRVPLRIKLAAMNGKATRRIAASVFLDVWGPVPCAARPVNRLEELSPDKITFVRRNMAYLDREVWDGKGGPWRLKSPVGTKQVIYQDNLELMPLVAKGDRVTLVYKGKRVTLSLPVEALADGAAGERITVRNLQSNKKVRATVQDSRTVVVN